MTHSYIINNYDDPKPKLVDDFYTYVNYDWLRSNKIPEDEDKYTHFIETQYSINNKLRKILESNLYPLGTILYNSCLNNDYRNKFCLNELKEILQLVDMVKTDIDLIEMNARLQFINVDVLFNIGVDTDTFYSCSHILYISQPTLGLANKIYYQNDKYKNIKQAYYNMICQIYKELYDTYTTAEINSIASLILNIETKLSIILLNNTEQRNKEIFNKVKLTTANHLYKKLYIKEFINTLCTLCEDIIVIENFDDIIMEHNRKDSTNYFKQLELIMGNFTIDEWKIYFKFKIILKYMNLTNSKMKSLSFDLYKKTIRGQQVEKPEWRLALAYTCGKLVDSMSRIYIHNYYSARIEDYIIEMVKYIKAATRKRIENLKWMSDKTKTKALLKLHKMRLKVGYSKTPARNYNHLTLTDSIIKNTIIINRDNQIYNLNKLNSKVNPEEWDLPSFMVNAYYNPTSNEIIFPAAILQPSFFDINKSDIYNYANIGSVIGHEIIHGFDDEGSKFDENGTLNNWWTDNDNKEYDKKVKQIINIYNKEGVNGQLTAGENIADFGAVILPLKALKYKLKRELTNDEVKEFYISYATHWQNISTKQSIEERILSDPHSMANLRVNIPLKHQKRFQEVFEIKKGDKLYVDPADQLIIW